MLKVYIIDVTSNSGMILITNAPINHLKGKMDNWDTYVSKLSQDYYVRVLYDSRKDDTNTVEVIGYDVSCYVNMSEEEILDYKIQKTFKEIKNADKGKCTNRLDNYDYQPAFYE